MNIPVFHSAFCILHSAFSVSRLALCIVHCALCIAFSAFAENATVIANNAKAEGILRAMADHGRKNKYAEVTNCYAQVAELLALKEGAPSSVTPYRLHMATGRALSEKLHLHWADLAAWHYAEALKVAGTPREKAEAILAAGRLEYDVVADDDPAPAIAKIRSALAVPGLSKADLLDLVFRYPASIDTDFDIGAEAWKIAEGEPSLHARYYNGILPEKTRGPTETLNPAQSIERALEICRTAIADPAVGPRDREKFVTREIDALMELKRDDEVEKKLLALAASTNQKARAAWNIRLGDFYVAKAGRYYLPVHEPTIRKALAAYAEASAASPGDGRLVENICRTAMSIRDYETAEKAVARRIEQNKGETNVWAWCQLGQIAHRREDYAAAASAFGAVEEKLDRASRRFYAESLNALGRIKETVAQLEKLEKEDYRSVKDSDRYYIQYLKKRLDEGTK